ncbi:hypothetical protein [Nocardia sp. NPDC052112]|uniref:hypothetical protein n=1 Tax=Nocardia sp. NPDC052112 TaxID=3155646 RepID=UPI003412CF63
MIVPSTITGHSHARFSGVCAITANSRKAAKLSVNVANPMVTMLTTANRRTHRIPADRACPLMPVPPADR